MEYELGKRLDNIEQMLYALCVAAGVVKQDEKKDEVKNETKEKRI